MVYVRDKNNCILFTNRRRLAMFADDFYREHSTKAKWEYDSCFAKYVNNGSRHVFTDFNCSIFI